LDPHDKTKLLKSEISFQSGVSNMGRSGARELYGWVSGIGGWVVFILPFCLCTNILLCPSAHFPYMLFLPETVSVEQASLPNAIVHFVLEVFPKEWVTLKLWTLGQAF